MSYISEKIRVWNWTYLVVFAGLLLGLVVVVPAGAVRPLSASIALVAGDEGREGFRDGHFTTALFRAPMGLAVSEDGTRLFVADSGNHRIRVIHLDQGNQVTTLCGMSEAGKRDGPLATAQFKEPRDVVCLP